MCCVSKSALLIFFAGYLTMALPLERKQRRLDFRVRTEVLQQGPPCETGAKMGDTIKITLATTKQTGDGVERTPQRTMQFRLGDHVLPVSEDRLIGHEASSDNFDMELISIGVRIPPEIDTSGDNTLDREEVANYLVQVYGDETPDQAAIDVIFNGIDTNDDGFIDGNEWQTVSD